MFQFAHNKAGIAGALLILGADSEAVPKKPHANSVTCHQLHALRRHSSQLLHLVGQEHLLISSQLVQQLV
jgi:hypothetical protein